MDQLCSRSGEVVEDANSEASQSFSREGGVADQSLFRWKRRSVSQRMRDLNQKHRRSQTLTDLVGCAERILEEEEEEEEEEGQSSTQHATIAEVDELQEQQRRLRTSLTFLSLSFLERRDEDARVLPSVVSSTNNNHTMDPSSPSATLMTTSPSLTSSPSTSSTSSPTSTFNDVFVAVLDEHMASFQQRFKEEQEKQQQPGTMINGNENWAKTAKAMTIKGRVTIGWVCEGGGMVPVGM